MATWHQQRSKARLFHDTKWTVLTDPPNDCRSAMLFNTRDEAQAWMERVDRPHTYMLAPASEALRRFAK